MKNQPPPKESRSPDTLVVRFRHLHPAAASSRANVGIKGPLATY
jgi:hypothetical protein